MIHRFLTKGRLILLFLLLLLLYMFDYAIYDVFLIIMRILCLVREGEGGAHNLKKRNTFFWRACPFASHPIPVIDFSKTWFYLFNAFTRSYFIIIIILIIIDVVAWSCVYYFFSYQVTIFTRNASRAVKRIRRAMSD